MLECKVARIITERSVDDIVLFDAASKRELVANNHACLTRHVIVFKCVGFIYDMYRFLTWETSSSDDAGTATLFVASDTWLVRCCQVIVRRI